MKNMRAITAVLLVLALLFTTGCAYLPEDIEAVLEEVEKIEENFQSEVMEPIREDAAIKEDEFKGESSEEATKSFFSSENNEEDTILTPSIEYRGITYTPYMTITDKLYEWIPGLEYKDISVDKRISWGHLGNDYFIETVSWEEWRTSVSAGPFLDQLDYGDYFADRFLASFYIEQQGASSNGIYIGDSREKILEIFPAEKCEQTSSGCTIFFHDGQVVSSDEYRAIHPVPSDGDKHEEKKFEFYYNTYVLYFYTGEDGRYVEGIGFFVTALR